MSTQLNRNLKAIGEIPTPISELLNEVEQFLSKYVAYPSKFAKIAHVLWIAHAHCMDEWDSTPRILFASAEPGSGKSRALELTETLVPRPIEAVNATPAYLFRKVSDPEGLPTILYDEIDTVFGPKARDNEEVRGFLNAGHRRGAMAGRCVTHGKTITTEELPAYCAVAMAGIGRLPDTIMTRSIVVRMRRQPPDERVTPYRRRIDGPTGYALRDRIAEWADNFQLDGIFPDMPEGVFDRAADVWEPLIAIADSAGEMWTRRAHEAAIALVSSNNDDSPSLGLRLLSDLQIIYNRLPSSVYIGTNELVSMLNLGTGLDDDAPWEDLYGKGINARQLAEFLKPYEVRPKKRREGETTIRGYYRQHLEDPWRRYLPSPRNAEHEEHVEQIASNCGDVPDVPVVPQLQEQASKQLDELHL